MFTLQSYLGTHPPLYSTKLVLDQKIRVENASDLEQIFGTRLAKSTRTRSSALLGQRVSVSSTQTASGVRRTQFVRVFLPRFKLFRVALALNNGSKERQ